MYAIGAAHWDRGRGGRGRRSGRAGGPRRIAQSRRSTSTGLRRIRSRMRVMQTAIPAQMPFGIGRLGSARAVKQEQKTILPAIRPSQCEAYCHYIP
jgi:hypothetical protein